MLRLIFPGVGAFGSAMASLREKGFVEPLRRYISSGRPFLGICIGMQVLFERSDENPGTEGLGVLPGCVQRFSAVDKAVPHMGWNHVDLLKESCPSAGAERAAADFRESAISYGINQERAYYFVHSFAVPYAAELKDWALCTTRYGSETFVAALARGRLLCTQFHPEKSGRAGHDVLRAFLERPPDAPPPDEAVRVRAPPSSPVRDRFTKRIVVALDVRANDEGDLVVTKGDKYDVREKAGAGEGAADKGRVRNMGKPVDLARKYYEEEGVDE
ncbi:MAG: class I glutamine amidotransferase-like protein, partial [Olpidium bornovanus]